jgi:predicted TIM-barrel fold metal-dependent hydrolase
LRKNWKLLIKPEITMKTKITLLFLAIMAGAYLQAQNADNILLKDYRPVSIFKVPVSNIERAAYPIIDAHTHNYGKNDAEVKEWIKVMDACGIEKSVVLTEESGPAFDSICKLYLKYSNRFEVWCGFDYTGYDKPGWGPAAVKELERCFKMGARGVGEEGDKGLGMFFNPVKAWGMHFDDPRMEPLFEKCAQLGMPISIHVADPIWMYEKMDSTNDGLMNAQTWRIDMTKPGIIGFDALLQSLENAIKNNPKTIFVACHFANLNHDMDKLGVLFDRYPNFYADISARYAESAPIPKYMRIFYEKYQDKLLYGTDMSFDVDMYRTTFRILESDDEHFYKTDLFGYHWALYGFGLPKNILKKIYHDNAARILK